MRIKKNIGATYSNPTTYGYEAIYSMTSYITKEKSKMKIPRIIYN